jgi:hypothetical protein
MSRWTHCLCAACFEKARPGVVPLRVKDSPEEACCACGTLTSAGIFYRGDPEEFPCGGKGGTHQEMDVQAAQAQMELHDGKWCVCVEEARAQKLLAQLPPPPGKKGGTWSLVPRSQINPNVSLPDGIRLAVWSRR